MSKIVKNTFIYTVGNVLPAAASFILLPIYTLYLSPSNYGIIESVNALNPILVILFSLCFGASIFRLFYDYKTVEQQKEFFGTLFISTTVSSLFFLFLILLFHKNVEHIYKSIAFNPYYLYMIITVFVSNFFDLPQKYLMLKDKARWYIALSLLQFVITSALILFFIINRKEGATGYLKAGLICSLVLLPIYLVISCKIIRFKFSFAIFKNLLSFSLPLIPTLLSAWVLNLSNRIFIERYFSTIDVGIYSLAYKIAGVVLIIVSSFNMAYRPAFFQYSNDIDVQRGRDSIYKYNYLFLLVFIIIVFITALFAEEIIVILFSTKYKDAFQYVPLIAFSYLLGVAGGFTGRFFEQSKKMKQNMFISIGMACLNVILNFLLIPSMGVYGAIFATIISLLIGFIFAYFYTKRNCYFVPFNWKILFPVAGSLILIVIVFQYIIDIQNIYLSLSIKIIVAGFIGLFLLRKYYKELKSIFGFPTKNWNILK